MYPKIGFYVPILPTLKFFLHDFFKFLAHFVAASPNSNSSKIQVKVGKKIHEIEMPVGHHFTKKEGTMRTSYVETSYHESLMGELLLSHSVHDFCIIGKKNALKI